MGLSGPDGLRGIKGAKGKDVSKFYCVKCPYSEFFWSVCLVLNTERYAVYKPFLRSVWSIV